jgi:NAD(P)-dependent dehydrogenase (short-subunit alcohol dehydrogenase family)
MAAAIGRRPSGGRIINISSLAATMPPDYSACKAAINAMTASMAKAVAADGITVNARLVLTRRPMFTNPIGLNPASASAPSVATLVDVTGLVIYFSIARATILDRIDVALGVCAG